MLTRRSILRGLLAGAVSAVARVSPLVTVPAAKADTLTVMQAALRRIDDASGRRQLVFYMLKPNALLGDLTAPPMLARMTPERRSEIAGILYKKTTPLPPTNWKPLA